LSCPKCGEQLDTDMKYCPKCGTATGLGAPRPVLSRVRERRAPKPPEILGVVSAGVVLILLAAAYIRYPIEPSVIADYFQSMAKQQQFLKPPQALLEDAFFFFNACGLWGIFLSVLRIVLERRPETALGDLVGGMSCFYVAFLLNSYANDVFTSRTTLAYLVMGIGVFVIVSALIHAAFRERR